MNISSQLLHDSLKQSPIAKGKTKAIFELQGDPSRVIVLSTDDITAGDGAKHDVIVGKGGFSNKTTCNIFGLLEKCGIPLAFDSENFSDLTSGVSMQHWFLADNCTMLPYEIVVRREAYGSYLKRNPGLKKGHRFPTLITEIFLKTNERKWKQYDLICDDPLIIHDRDFDTINLFSPSEVTDKPFKILAEEAVFSTSDEHLLLEKMRGIALNTFSILEKAWCLQGLKLIDFKVEFGLNKEGKLLLADVIDADSWRLLTTDGEHLDKDPYRQGGSTTDTFNTYRYVAQLTDAFTSLTGEWYKS